jgi:hypothetical protein
MMSRIDSRHWKISTGRHFQNGHHNVAKIWKLRPVEIVQCRDSIRDIIIYPHIKLWWYRTMLNLKNFYWSPFLKCPPQYHTNSTLPDFNAISHVGRLGGTSLSTHISNCDEIVQCWIFAILWWPFWKWRQFNMWVDNEVPNWFPTLNNFYWSPFSKWPPQYRKTYNVDFFLYCGGHFENGDR